MKCAVNSTYDAQTKTCKTPLTSSNATVTPAPTCEVRATLNPLTQKCECPAGTYSNKIECLSCPAPNYWDAKTLQCLTCSAGLVYVKELGRCEICPTSAPLIINGECRPCPTNSSYDKYNQVCVRCSVDSRFNSASGQCELIPVITPPPKCSVGGSYDSRQGKCVCPLSLPYDNGAVCLACDLPYFWN